MPLITFDMGINHALRSNGIMPSIVPETFRPSTLLKLNYIDDEVDLGNSIKPSNCQKQPKIEIYSGNTKDNYDTYTLIMVDPDAPSRKDAKYRFYRHWVLTGISEPSDTSHASVKASYVAPAPPKGSGDHRYLFLLYKQPNATVTFEPFKYTNRAGWNYTSFISDSNLELVGANFFLSKNELDLD